MRITSRRRKVTAVLAITILAALGCEKEDKEHGCGDTNISHHGAHESHNHGQNCMSCHRDGGGGEGCFTVAGSVYDSLGTGTAPNGTVRLFTGANGTGSLRATIEVDAKGNFHTTDGVDFSGGLYPVLVGSGGDAHHMSDAITSGACNSCHGQSTDRITVDQ